MRTHVQGHKSRHGPPQRPRECGQAPIRKVRKAAYVSGRQSSRGRGRSPKPGQSAENVRNFALNRTWSGRISRRVEMELKAGKSNTVGPCPYQSMSRSIDTPSHCHVSRSLCIERFHLKARVGRYLTKRYAAPYEFISLFFRKVCFRAQGCGTHKMLVQSALIHCVSRRRFALLRAARSHYVADNGAVRIPQRTIVLRGVASGVKRQTRFVVDQLWTMSNYDANES